MRLTDPIYICCGMMLAGLLFGSTLVLADESDVLRRKYQDSIDRSVDRGLAFLAKQQITPDQARANGRPELAGSFADALVPGNTGIAALSVMAFLAKGHTPGSGPYGDVINRGIDYLLTQQHDNGLLICKHRKGRTTGLMYSHSIATLLLCEVSGMVDPQRQQKIDEVLPRALLVLLQSQKVPKPEHSRGGWRYGPGTTESDLSLTGWSIMALRAAKLNGAAIPDEHIAMAISYVLRCRGDEGAFKYMPHGRGVHGGSASMTGVAVLCLELCGEHGHESIKPAGEFILRNPPIISNDGTSTRFCFYALYYCGQAMFQLGGKYWEQFAPHMYDNLLANQRNDGSWGYPEDKSRFSDTYPTALAVLTLTVSARQLPIYQREE